VSASALGLAGISHRLNKNLIKKLDAEVAALFNEGKLNLQAARELAHVTTERQREIVDLMGSVNDFSITFVRGLVLKIPASKRIKSQNGAKSPWDKAGKNKVSLLNKLKEAEQQQDFFTGLYRQYTTNLLKLVIYARSLLNNERIRAYLESNHPQTLEAFSRVIENTEQ
jgi:hypothetical protein